VDYSAVPYDIVVANSDIGGAVNNRIIFNAGIVSDYGFAEIRPDNGSRPDARVLTDFNVAHDVGGFADKC
jgi:hypothetical protein